MFRIKHIYTSTAHSCLFHCGTPQELHQLIVPLQLALSVQILSVLEHLFTSIHSAVDKHVNLSTHTADNSGSPDTQLCVLNILYSNRVFCAMHECEHQNC